jgi:hypothetical protein
MTTIPTVDDLVAGSRRLHDESFIPSRYPYTYAADFLRNNPHLIPGNVRRSVIGDPGHELHYADGWLLAGTAMSRSEAASIEEGWARLAGVDERDLAERLAGAYMSIHGIQQEESA